MVTPGPAIRSGHRDLLLPQEAVSRVKPDKLVAVADELAALVAQIPAAMWTPSQNNVNAPPGRGR